MLLNPQPIRIDIGGQPDEVLYLRDVADADNLVRVIQQQGEGSRAIVIGGGYIGTEVGAGLLSNGLKVRESLRNMILCHPTRLYLGHLCISRRPFHGSAVYLQDCTGLSGRVRTSWSKGKRAAVRCSATMMLLLFKIVSGMAKAIVSDAQGKMTGLKLNDGNM